MTHRWRIANFDPAIGMDLTLTLDAADPRAALLVEAAAAAEGVELVRIEEGSTAGWVEARTAEWERDR